MKRTPETRKKAMSAADGLEQAMSGAVYDKPSTSEMRRIISGMDWNKVLKWDNLDCLAEFFALVQNPPLHSVVVRMAPEVCKWFLENRNTMNRPLSKRASDRLSVQFKLEEIALTGDTVKFSRTGIMLDGQHRLEGARLSNMPITSHVVFGLEDSIFDILDQGKKRTAGDILALCHVQDYNIVAAAARQATHWMRGLTGDGGALTVREVREAVQGPMSDISEYATAARLIHTAFKHPPSGTAAILYMISRKSRTEAKNFAHEWVHGAKIGRNENFDILSGRLIAVERAGGGHINRHVRAAMIIQMFNHWHAEIVATPRALSWRKGLAFPVIEWDKAAFLKKREQNIIGDTSAPASMERLLVALGRYTDDDGNAQVALPELGRKASIPPNQVGDILRQMEEHELVHKVRSHSSAGPAIYHIKDKGLHKLRSLAESA